MSISEEFPITRLISYQLSRNCKNLIYSLLSFYLLYVLVHNMRILSMYMISDEIIFEYTLKLLLAQNIHILNEHNWHLIFEYIF